MAGEDNYHKMEMKRDYCLVVEEDNYHKTIVEEEDSYRRMVVEGEDNYHGMVVGEGNYHRMVVMEEGNYHTAVEKVEGDNCHIVVVAEVGEDRMEEDNYHTAAAAVVVVVVVVEVEPHIVVGRSRVYRMRRDKSWYRNKSIFLVDLGYFKHMFFY